MRITTLCCALFGVAALMAQSPDPQYNGSGLPNLGGNQFQAYASPNSFLGVGLIDENSEHAKSLGLDEAKGAEVVKVEAGTPASKAGIKPGDVLLTYNGENILGAVQLGRLVRETPPGRKLKIELWRDGHSLTVALTTEAPKRMVGQQIFMTPMPDLPISDVPDLPSTMLMWKSGLLGIYCESVDSQLADYFGVKQGVLVRSVVNASPAQRAGLKAGDVLTKVGDRIVASPRDVTAALHLQGQAGKPVLIVFARERKEMTLKVVLENASPLYQHLAPSAAKP
ncbi:MAG: PDZ domain-containing protein [Bryobacteraceae bacterium]